MSKAFSAVVHIDSQDRPDEQSFCAALVPVPDFPDDQPAIDAIGERRLAVVGCNDDGGSWGYVELSPDEKQVIGDAITNAGGEIGRWYWCGLFVDQVIGGES